MKNIRTRIAPYFTLFLVLSLPIFIGRCGKLGPPAGSFGDVYQNVIVSANCAAQCHVPGGTATSAGAQIDFTSQTTSYDTLTTKSVGGASSVGCGAVKIVKSGDPSKSYLAAVLISTYNTTTVGCTPLNTHITGIANLSETQKSSIVTWITNGAKND